MRMSSDVLDEHIASILSKQETSMKQAADSFTLNMEAVRSSETSVEIYCSTKRFIPKERLLRDHCCENLKFNTCLLVANSDCFQKNCRV
jgi:hypothetical protein